MVSDRSHNDVAAAVARIPSGLAILTAAHGKRATGMLASWIQQASFEPMMVTVCVKRGRPIEPLIDEAGTFVLNLLGDDATALMKHFSRGIPLDEDAFAGLNVRSRTHGVQIDGCIAHIACEVTAKVPAGDHFIYVACAVAGQTHSDAAPRVHVRATAAGY